MVPVNRMSRQSNKLQASIVGGRAQFLNLGSCDARLVSG